MAAASENEMLHGEHDDGLWPDFDIATESVRTQPAVDTGYAHDTVVTHPEKATKASQKRGVPSGADADEVVGN